MPSARGVVEQGARRRDAEGPRGHGLLGQADHGCNVLVGGGVLGLAALAHGVPAEGAVPDHAAGVHALGHAVEGVEVAAVGLPGPVQAGHDGVGRDVLHRLHDLGQEAAVLGLARGEAHAAVAEHDRGHPVPARRGGDGIPRQLGVEMGVDVDEARGHVLAVGVELAAASADVGADLAHPVAVDGHVGRHRLGPRPVDHQPTPDHEIMCHGAPLALGPARARGLHATAREPAVLGLARFPLPWPTPRRHVAMTIERGFP